MLNSFKFFPVWWCTALNSWLTIILIGLALFLTWWFKLEILITLLAIIFLLFISIKYPAWSWRILLLEMFLGGHGHAISAFLTLRQWIFISVLVAIGIKIYQDYFSALPLKAIMLGFKSLLNKFKSDYFSGRYALSRLSLILLIIILLGMAQAGLNEWPLNDVFKVANAWVYWILLPATIFWTADWWHQWWRETWPILIGAWGVMVLFSIINLIIFSFNFVSGDDAWYRWIRQAGLGEITRVWPTYYRIFLYSQVYALWFWAVGLITLIKQDKLFERFWPWLLLLSAQIVLYLSLSRSFWVGQFTLSLGLLVWTFFQGKINLKILGQKIIWIIILVISVSGLVNWTVTVINPAFSGVIKNYSRLTIDDAAGASRRQLLAPLWQAIKADWFSGTGFGTPITYKTSDPRILAQNPDGWYTTTVFEWGHLGNWLQLGFIGYLAWLFVLLALILPRLKNENLIVSALAFGCFGLFCVHIFTPYLDHPLGIITLIFLATWPIVENKTAYAMLKTPESDKSSDEILF